MLYLIGNEIWMEPQRIRVGYVTVPEGTAREQLEYLLILTDEKAMEIREDCAYEEGYKAAKEEFV